MLHASAAHMAGQNWWLVGFLTGAEFSPSYFSYHPWSSQGDRDRRLRHLGAATADHRGKGPLSGAGRGWGARGFETKTNGCAHAEGRSLLGDSQYVRSANPGNFSEKGKACAACISIALVLVSWCWCHSESIQSKPETPQTIVWCFRPCHAAFFAPRP